PLATENLPRHRALPSGVPGGVLQHSQPPQLYRRLHNVHQFHLRPDHRRNGPADDGVCPAPDLLALWGSLSSCARPGGYPAYRRSWRVANPPQGVPSMGSVLLDERSQSGPMTATVAKPQGATARGKPKEAGGKLSTVGTRTGSEAGCGRQAGPEQRSRKVIKTHQVEPDGAREQSLHLTWGDLLGESRGEVSRG